MSFSLRRMAIVMLVASVLAVVFGLRPAGAQAATICVNGNGPVTPGTGSCWASPYKSLPSALGAAQAGDEIWVAKGVYTPGLTVNNSFLIRSGISLYGGFAATETVRTQRNWAANVTVLSGDIDGNDITAANGTVITTTNIVGTNAYHVVWLDGATKPLTATTRLDGFVITAGRASGAASAGFGGGVYCNGQGGSHMCSPTLANVTFSGNAATNGGAMNNNGNSSGTSSPALTNVTFIGTAATNGGAMFNDGNAGVSRPALTNVTFTGNAATNGGAMFNDGSSGVSRPTLKNVILWGNKAPNGPQIYNASGTPAVTYSLVQGGWTGTGNIDANPLFANAAAGNLSLLPGSPAIDAGTNSGAPATDLRGLPRPVNGITDMGAYEAQGFSLTVTGGNAQYMTAGSAFAIPLKVRVSSIPGETVGPGGVLTFTPPATGPGLSTGVPFTVTTAVNGVASTIATANAIAGSYKLTVTAHGVISPVVFSLTNQPCPTGQAYVNKAAAGNRNGTSWTNAFIDLQRPLLVAAGCGTFSEIWVAKGIYTPGLTVSSTFTIRSGVSVYGGFAATETVRSQRNWGTNVTILSGDIDGNDVTTAGVVITTSNIVGNNAYNVVWVDGATAPITNVTRLDGLVITAGRANDLASKYSGGGVYCNGTGSGHKCNPAIANVTFSGNSANYGGAMGNDGSSGGVSSPTLANVTFSGNSALLGGALYNDGTSGVSSPIMSNIAFSGNSATFGGAVYNEGKSGVSSPTLTNVTFSRNLAGRYGGAIINDGQYGVSSPRLTNVTFSANSGLYNGGAMYNYGYFGASSPTLTNVVFSHNTAGFGGAIYNSGDSGVCSPVLTNVTFGGNSAFAFGGAMYSSGPSGVSSPTLTNVIMWGNSQPSGAQIYTDTATPTVTYSLVQGGWPGTGNIDANPLFANPTAGNLTLLPGSPAIDSGGNTGAPAKDIRGLPRPVNGVTDMGAYEIQGFNLAITAGTPQTTIAGTAFATPLTIKVSSTQGEAVGPGGVITFTPPASGPGLTKISPFTATTNASGVATVKVTANLVPGTYSVNATARGAATPVLFNLTNLRRPVTVTLTSKPATAVFGQSVTFTANVAVAAPGGGTPTGVVTFTVDGAPITRTLSNRVATYKTAGLSVGSHLVRAAYAGDSNFTPGASSVLTKTVGKATTTTALTSQPATIVAGQSVTFTALVSVTAPGAGTPTGVMTFTVDGVPITRTLSNRIATYKTTSLSAGSHQVKATYAGNSNFTVSASSILTYTVGRIATTTTLVNQSATAATGQTMTFTATVAADAPDAGAPMGIVTFTVDGVPVAVPLTNGIASYSAANPTAGNHEVTATYSGDDVFDASNSTALTQGVADTLAQTTVETPTQSVLDVPAPSTVETTTQTAIDVPIQTLVETPTQTAAGPELTQRIYLPHVAQLSPGTGTTEPAVEEDMMNRIYLPVMAR